MTDAAERVLGPAIAWDEIRICPICGKDIMGMGEVSCGDHYRGYSFPNLRRLPVSFSEGPKTGGRGVKFSTAILISVLAPPLGYALGAALFWLVNHGS